MFGKRQTERLDKASVVPPHIQQAAANSNAPLASTESAPEKPEASTNVRPSEEYTRWYLPVGIGGTRVGDLCDSGSSRTALGWVGLQMASECGKTITPHNGSGARLADGTSVPILDHVELHFHVAGVRRYIDVIIVNERSGLSPWRRIYAIIARYSAVPKGDPQHRGRKGADTATTILVGGR